jgi:hypothetical protein
MGGKSNRRRRLAREKKKRDQQQTQKAKRVDARTPLQKFVQDVLQLQQDNYIGTQMVPVVGGGEAKRCHENCRRMRNDKGEAYELVTCWIIFDSDEVRATTIVELHGHGRELTPEIEARFPRPNEFEAEFHCVIRDQRTGLLSDITPGYNETVAERRIVLEPRMTAGDFERFSFSTPENIVNRSYARRCPTDPDNPDFFGQLGDLDQYRRLLDAGTSLCFGLYGGDYSTAGVSKCKFAFIISSVSF